MPRLVQNSTLPKWASLREPVGVVTLSVVALVSCLGVALYFFPPQAAPQFYTPVFTAMAGMLGALLGASYNARLAHRRDDRLERVRVIAVARVAVNELSHAHAILRNRVAFFRKKVVTRVEPETAELKARRYVMLEWNIRGFLTQLVTLELGTPELDKHILALCQQSDEIAKSLLEFRRLRADMAMWVPSLTERYDGIEPKPDEMDPTPLELEEWQDMLDGFYEIRTELEVLIPALNSFLQRHAGEFA